MSYLSERAKWITRHLQGGNDLPFFRIAELTEITDFASPIPNYTPEPGVIGNRPRQPELSWGSRKWRPRQRFVLSVGCVLNLFRVRGYHLCMAAVPGRDSEYEGV